MSGFRFSLMATAWMIAAAAVPTDAAPIIDEKKLRPETMEVPDLGTIRASCNGKYRTLLRKIEVPADKDSYGEFHDWGPWSGTSWAGHDDLPPGYWVYVAPHWYIWKECDESKAGAGQGGDKQGAPSPSSGSARSIRRAMKTAKNAADSTDFR